MFRLLDIEQFVLILFQRDLDIQIPWIKVRTKIRFYIYIIYKYDRQCLNEDARQLSVCAQRSLRFGGNGPEKKHE